jgi:TRAP-type C4-dicarboxylate transport system substrate-binding protein
LKTNKVLSLLLVGLLIFTVFLIAGCGAEESVVEETEPVEEEAVDEFVKLSIGSLYSVEEPHSMAIIKFQELVEEKTGGTVEIEFFPAAQTGGGTVQLESVMQGTQDMFFDGTGWSATFVKNHMHESLFFLFDSKEQHVKFLQSDYIKDTQQQLLDNYNLRTLPGMALRSPRQLVSTEPVQTLEDLAGMRWRVPASQAYPESADALASAVTIAFSEVYVALQQGIADIVCGIAPSVYDMKFYEVAPYITKTAHVHAKVDLWINEDSWKKLSANQQAAVNEAAVEMANYFTQMMEENEEKFFELMEAEGATILEFSDEERARWKQLVAEKAVPALVAQGAYDEGLYEEIIAFLEGN